MSLIPGYEVRKAAQAAAFFALRQGGAINVLKLSKLLYLAEREFMARHDAPMFYDKLASMPDGPVASITLNLINGDFEHPDWSRYVAPRQGYDIKAIEGTKLEGLDELSKADIAVLTDLWQKFGGWDRYALRDWTHKPENVPEWTDPQGSSAPITYASVFKKLGKENVDVLVRDIDEHKSRSRLINSVK